MKFFYLPSTLREGLGEGEPRINKQNNFTAYLFHPHPTSPIKGEEFQLNLNSTTLGIKPTLQKIGIIFIAKYTAFGTLTPLA
jgi:hypothetical protein